MFYHLLNEAIRFSKSDIGITISFLIGIVGFILSISAIIRTKNISHVLERRRIIEKYNTERQVFIQKLDGHAKSILVSSVQTRSIIYDIQKDVKAIEQKFHILFSRKDRKYIIEFLDYLKRPYSSIDYKKIADDLSYISGRLSKEEYNNEQ